jgi:hypothetical protein
LGAKAVACPTIIVPKIKASATLEKVQGFV